MNIAPGMYAELPNGLQFDEARSEGEIYLSSHSPSHGRFSMYVYMYVCMYVWNWTRWIRRKSWTSSEQLNFRLV